MIRPHERVLPPHRPDPSKPRSFDLAPEVCDDALELGEPRFGVRHAESVRLLNQWQAIAFNPRQLVAPLGGAMTDVPEITEVPDGWITDGPDRTDVPLCIVPPLTVTSSVAVIGRRVWRDSFSFFMTT